MSYTSLSEFDVTLLEARKLVENGATLPRALCFFKVPDCNAKCDNAIGDPSKTYAEQFYSTIIGEEHFVVPVRSKIGITGDPTGNYEEIPDEDFAKWVTLFGSANLYMPSDLPEGEVI